MTHNNAFNLPAAPPELCFDKNEFVKKSFSVDEFLQAHRQTATMETMRDDLGVYLKVLRSAMIELINEDYADFVNLASNLRGLDQQIGGILAPLQQLRADIVDVKATLTDTMDELTVCLDEKRSLRDELRAVQARSKVDDALANIETLLATGETPDQTVLERTAMEYVQVAFEMQFCTAGADTGDTDGDGANVVDIQQRVSELHRRLLDALETHFLQTLSAVEPPTQSGTESLERCLRIFCTLDECHVAEEIFRRRAVAKHMNTIIAESALQNSPQGVHGIYAQVIGFVQQRMSALLALTHPQANGEAARVRGFDFLLRSYWPEVEQRLETHLSSIFAPGNPDQFYQKYQSTVEFLRQLELVLGTDAAVAAFKEHPQYRCFQTRWNLPVYFQIRFQEIGATLETACTRPIGSVGTWSAASAGRPRLAPIAAAIQCFRRCWADGVYLPQIFMRFWKFALQILARIARWVDEFVALAEWPTGGGSAGLPATLVDALVVCHVDVRLLIDELPALLGLVTEQLTDDALRAKQEPLLRRCVDETRRFLTKRLGSIETRVVTELLAGSVPNIRLVNDIPRLFRKTNREVPSKAAAYVDQMLRSSVQFAVAHRASIGGDVLETMLLSAFCQLNTQYYVAVADVLTSVQKTEESLRRLKNLREKTTTTLQPTSAVAADQQQRPLMTDDDKIRLQLLVDVVHWTDAIEQLGVGREQVEQLVELNALVEESTRVKVAPV